MATSPMQWQAVYKDGTIYTEKELDTSEKIDRTQLKEFKLFQGEKLVFVGFFGERRKLIFRRRTFLDSGGNVQGIVYLVGWHENFKGVSVKSICYIYEDGHIEFDNDRNDLELVKCEI